MRQCPSSAALYGAAPPAPANFLARLDTEALADLRALASVQHYAKGDFVFRSGVADSNVYFLRVGKIKVHHLSPVGREVILWFCFPGEIFGLAEVAGGGDRVVNAQVCLPSEVLVIAQERFRHFLVGHPQAASLSMQVLASRLRALGEMCMDLISNDVRTRVVKLILRLSTCYGSRVGNETFLDIMLTHQEIADMIGTTRQTVTSSLSTLKRQGILGIDHHRIHVKNHELLNGLTRNK